MDNATEAGAVPQKLIETPSPDHGSEVPQPIVESKAQEAPVRLSPEEAAMRQAQIDKLREMFQQQAKEGAPLTEPAPETEVPTRLDAPVLGPTQSPIKRSAGADGLKNLFASFGKVGESIKKVVQAPGKILKAVGNGIMKFWTAGDSVRPPLAPPQGA